MDSTGDFTAGINEPAPITLCGTDPWKWKSEHPPSFMSALEEGGLLPTRGAWGLCLGMVAPIEYVRGTVQRIHLKSQSEASNARQRGAFWVQFLKTSKDKCFYLGPLGGSADSRNLWVSGPKLVWVFPSRWGRPARPAARATHPCVEQSGG